jgi:hypothetical protein
MSGDAFDHGEAVGPTPDLPPEIQRMGKRGKVFIWVVLPAWVVMQSVIIVILSHDHMPGEALGPWIASVSVAAVLVLAPAILFFSRLHRRRLLPLGLLRTCPHCGAYLALSARRTRWQRWLLSGCTCAACGSELNWRFKKTSREG